MKASACEISLLSTSLSETKRIGAVIASCLSGGECIGLVGSLGAGKTELVRGLAEAFSIGEAVSSPSYVLENVYALPAGASPGIQSICHWDLYRVGSLEEKNEIAEYADDLTKVVLVEWPDRAAWLSDLLSLEISLEFSETGGASVSGGSDSGVRRISFRAVSEEDRGLFDRLRERFSRIQDE